MIPNSADKDGNLLFETAKTNASKKLYTTFIGIGVGKFLKSSFILSDCKLSDFNNDLVSLISTIRASNYFAVKSTKDFKRQMDEEFDYMVTPNVFNVDISLVSDSWEAGKQSNVSISSLLKVFLI